MPVVSRPKPVQLNDVRVYVVNERELDSFITEFKDSYGELAYVALSMQDYENLALNIAELRRYINQQTEIIIYYENAVTPESPATQENTINQNAVTISETKLN